MFEPRFDSEEVFDASFGDMGFGTSNLAPILTSLAEQPERILCRIHTK
jgi:hypothetical protein